ncbi:MAG: hypothetical protein IPH22_15365 [Nitrosomonas sp.]|nr:hypothetical protein [Nitrosomonas sp.]
MFFLHSSIDTIGEKPLCITNTCNAAKIIDHLPADTFVPADKAIVTDHMVAQMAAGKTFGAMIVWAIDTWIAPITTILFGRAAALFKNRIEVSKYYSIDEASNATLI